MPDHRVVGRAEILGRLASFWGSPIRDPQSRPARMPANTGAPRSVAGPTEIYFLSIGFESEVRSWATRTGRSAGATTNASAPAR
jgi:hypothetical protein